VKRAVVKPIIRYEITCSRLYLGEKLPPVDRIDWLIIMGGPMSVNDELEYPWFVEEMRFVGQTIDAGKTILGICLGAQLLAKVLGSDVYPKSTQRNMVENNVNKLDRNEVRAFK